MKFEEAAETKPVRNYSAILHTSSKMCHKLEVQHYNENVTSLFLNLYFGIIFSNLIASSQGLLFLLTH